MRTNLLLVPAVCIHVIISPAIVLDLRILFPGEQKKKDGETVLY